jgi:hypothetical protein
VTYVEAHGTATPMGDPIEVAALTAAFQQAALHPGTKRTAFCALGSVKSNFGHLDTAAGIAGLIKTVLALENREIPPSLHFHRPNPQIDFATGPFRVNTRLVPWLGDAPTRGREFFDRWHEYARRGAAEDRPSGEASGVGGWCPSPRGLRPRWISFANFDHLKSHPGLPLADGATLWPLAKCSESAPGAALSSQGFRRSSPPRASSAPGGNGLGTREPPWHFPGRGCNTRTWRRV